uniref:EF-hand domain-containing protein n=1 Tax=Marseillevirus LCMAC101 TaxID=2506602 RepID=A0A481YRX3_9VIRU|nr:MAG: hypothetical protein LCMAC101_02720 [Marseillevirus LCMAC101]
MSCWRRKKKDSKKFPTPSQLQTGFLDSADANNDGIITRKEMESYINSQLRERDEKVFHLRKAYDDLFEKHSQLLEQIARNNIMDVNKRSNISGEAIQKFVDELLADPNVNIYGFPDKIESALYRNTIRMILGAMEKLFNNVSIDFIGHKITVVMEPTVLSEEDFSDT